MSTRLLVKSWALLDGLVLIQTVLVGAFGIAIFVSGVINYFALYTVGDPSFSTFVISVFALFTEHCAIPSSDLVRV